MVVKVVGRTNFRRQDMVRLAPLSLFAYIEL